MADQPITRRQAGQILGAAAASPLLAAEAPDICFLTAVEMAGLIRRKKLSARQAHRAEESASLAGMPRQFNRISMH